MSDTGDDDLDAIAEEIGDVAVSDGYFERADVPRGEQFGYDPDR
jgi:hypothetical protein